MAKIRLQNIVKRYGKDVEAVKDFNLEINDQEFIILVGPSGCGKSTTLRLIAGLEEVTSGQIYIDGKAMEEKPAKDRDIAMVFQNYALYPHMTVYENLAFCLQMQKLPRNQIDKKVRETARTLGLGTLLGRKPKALSGGEKQRVAIGRALVREPKVFLMDEPLSNLDAKLRVQMRMELAELHRRLGATIIYVTHDQVEAMALGSRIVVMNNGIIQQVGTPQQLYECPCNKFVAGFIGSPQMNFFNAATLKNHKAKTIGIRPEHIHICENGDYGLYVQKMEFVGAEVYFHGRIFEEKVVVRDNQMRKESFLRVNIPYDKLHFFDENGQRCNS